MTPGIGGKTVVRVIERNRLLGRAPDEFLALSEESLREEYRLPRRPAEALRTGGREALARTAALEARLESLGVVLFTAADPHYPAIVEAFDPDPPGVLFAYGNLKLLSRPTFAVMGSRGTTPRGPLHRRRRVAPADADRPGPPAPRRLTP
ncbi:hypothetical protein EON77_12730 [bacterium]|nr:MAG: hypothetical protein EON77_12730 [bacterium]